MVEEERESKEDKEEEQETSGTSSETNPGLWLSRARCSKICVDSCCKMKCCSG